MFGVFVTVFLAYFRRILWRICLASPGVFPGVFFGEVALLKTCASTLGVFFRRIFVADPSLFVGICARKKSQEKKRAVAALGSGGAPATALQHLKGGPVY